MKSSAHTRLQHWPRYLVASVALFAPILIYGQEPDQAGISSKVDELSAAIVKAQLQIDESQRQLQQMREQLNALEKQLGTKPAQTDATSTSDRTLPAELEEVKEQQAIENSQLATLAQEKVESDSKYPIKLNGLVLFTGFSNSTRTDNPATPTSALFGRGSAGATFRQSILGVDARGPRLFGAESRADVRVDFDGEPASSSSNAYSNAYGSSSTLLRLRTAHAALDWKNTSIFFSLDRPILSPDTPSSLTALAEPALAWSGNLWNWNPQFGIEHYIATPSRGGLLLQAALIDPADAPQTRDYGSKSTSAPVSGAELRMRPGGEFRLAWTGIQRNNGPHGGVGLYVSPHTSISAINFNAWATTADLNFSLGSHFELSGSGYRGQALGGLGGGAYKDYVTGTLPNGKIYFQALDDLGGWAQLKQKLNERLQFNEAFGMDQIFARQLRTFVGSGTQGYLNFAHNRTWSGNAIYSPSAYLLFSFEYRRIETAPVAGHLWTSNIYGVAAGYRF